VLRGAQGERERLVMEARRVETLLRSALGLVEEGNALAWPERSDTREFQAIDPEAEAAASEPEPADEQLVAEPEPSRDFNWG